MFFVCCSPYFERVSATLYRVRECFGRICCCHPELSVLSVPAAPGAPSPVPTAVMAAPWSEGPYKVVVEFLKSGSGASRTIQLKHSAVVPPQLQGRVPPHVWQAFMADIEQAAQQHPYVVKPSAGRVGSWLACGALGAVIGCCAINPDGGDYGVWLPQVQGLIDRHQPAFAAAGCQLSLQRAQQSHWVQIDVNPNVAVGQPVAAPPPGAYPQEPQKPGYEPAKPGYEPTPGYEGKPPY